MSAETLPDNYEVVADDASGSTWQWTLGYRGGGQLSRRYVRSWFDYTSGVETGVFRTLIKTS